MITIEPEQQLSLILSCQVLQAFVNNLLSTLHDSSPTTDIAKVDSWGLKGNDGTFIQLNTWDSRTMNDREYYTIVPLPLASEVTASHPPIHLEWALLGANTLQPLTYIRRITLPSNEMFELHDCHILLTIACYQKSRKNSRKSKTKKLTITRHNMMLPPSLTVADIIKAFEKIGTVYEVCKGSEIEVDLRTDPRTIAQHRWQHGTELKLKMFYG